MVRLKCWTKDSIHNEKYVTSLGATVVALFLCPLIYLALVQSRPMVNRCQVSSHSFGVRWMAGHSSSLSSVELTSSTFFSSSHFLLLAALLLEDHVCIATLEHERRQCLDS
jgi:hypothetical protein